MPALVFFTMIIDTGLDSEDSMRKYPRTLELYFIPYYIISYKFKYSCHFFFFNKVSAKFWPVRGPLYLQYI